MGKFAVPLQQLRQSLKKALSYVKRRLALDLELHELLSELMLSLESVQVHVLPLTKLPSQTLNHNMRLETECRDILLELQNRVKQINSLLIRIKILREDEVESDIAKAKFFSSENSVVNEINSESLWPLLFLPDRNLLLIDIENKDESTFLNIKKDEVPVRFYKHFLDQIQVKKRPEYLLVVNNHGVEGIGKTEFVLESVYRSLDRGGIGMVLWFSCRHEAGLVSSLKSVAAMISRCDPRFEAQAKVKDGANTNLASLIGSWINTLMVPYLIVFDDIENVENIPVQVIPSWGKGSVLFLSSSVNHSKLCDLLDMNISVFELPILSKQSLLYIIVQSIGQDDDTATDNISALELIDKFSLCPLELLNAIILLNFLRSKSFLYFGVTEFLNFVSKNQISLPGYGSASSSGANELERIKLIYKMNMIRYNCAINYTYNGSSPALRKIMDFFVFLCCDSVSINLIYRWIGPKNAPIGFKVVQEIAKKEKEVEYVLEIFSLLPRPVNKCPDCIHKWTVVKRHSELISFFRDVSCHCTSLHTVLNLATDSSINTLITTVLADANWPLQADNSIVKRFFDINETSDTDCVESIIHVLNPLLTLNLIRIRSRRIDSYGLNFSVSFHKSLQESFKLLVQQEGYFATIMSRVIKFLQLEFDREGSGALPKEMLVSHIISCMSHNVNSTDESLGLCLNVYNFVYEKKCYHDAETLARLGISMLDKKNPTLDEALDICLNILSIYQEMHKEDTSNFDIMRHISLFHTKIGLIYQYQGLSKSAENQFIESLELLKSIGDDSTSVYIDNLEYLVKLNDSAGSIDKALLFSTEMEEKLKSIANLDTTYRLISVYEYRATLYMKSDQKQLALNTLQSLVVFFENMYGGLLHAKIALVFRNIAKCHFLELNFESATLNIKQSLDIYKKLDNESDTYIDRLDAVQLFSEICAEDGDLEEAINQINDMINISKKAFGEQDLRFVSCLNKKGNLLQAAGKLQEAQLLFEEALELSLNCKINFLTVECLNNLAELSRTRSDFAQAVLYSADAIVQLKEFCRGQNSAVLAEQLILSADVYKDNKNFEEAKDLYSKAYEIRLKLFGNKNRLVAQCLLRLSELYLENGEINQSNVFKEKAILIFKDSENVTIKNFSKIQDIRSSNPSLISVSSSAVKHVSILPIIGDESGAVEDDYTNDKTLNILIKQFGENNPRVAVALNNLAIVSEKKKDYDEARIMRLKALKVLQKAHGEYHPHTAQAFFNLGKLYFLEKCYDKAIEHINGALIRQRKLFGNYHNFVSISLHTLGELYYLLLRYDDSKLCLEEALAIRRVLFGDKSAPVYVCLNNLGIVLKRILTYKEAESHLRESLAIRQEFCKDQDFVVAVGFNSLGLLLLAMGRLVEARELLETAVSIRSKLGPENELTVNSINNLAEVYYAQGKIGQAISMFQNIIKIRTQNSILVIDTLKRLRDIFHNTQRYNEEKTIELKIRELNIDEIFGTTLSFTLDGFEEEDGNVGKLIKTDSSKGSKIDYLPLTSDKISRLKESSVIPVNDNWPIELLARLQSEFKVLTELDKKESYVFNERGKELTDIENNIFSLTTKEAEEDKNIEALTELVKNDKRYVAQLQLRSNECKEISNKISALQEIKTTISKEMNSLKMSKEVRNQQSQEIEYDINQLQDCIKNKSAEELVMEQVSKLIHLKKIELEKLSFKMANSSVGEMDADLVDGMKRILEDEKELYLQKEMSNVKLKVLARSLDDIKNKFGISTKDIEDTRTPRNSSTTVTINAEEIAGSNKSIELDESQIQDQELLKKYKDIQDLVEMLKNQIIGLGSKPILEVITFEQAEKNYQKCLSGLMEGFDLSDELDKWDSYMRNHPEFKLREKTRNDAWEQDNRALNYEALLRIRSIVPSNICASSLQSLESMLPVQIAKRVWKTKALWLTRMSSARIAKLHIADLQTKYATQGLDEIELRAIWTSLPEKFENDGSGTKDAWKKGVFQSLTNKCKTDLPWIQEGILPSTESVLVFLNSISPHVQYKSFKFPGPFEPLSAFEEDIIYSETVNLQALAPVVPSIFPQKINTIMSVSDHNKKNTNSVDNDNISLPLLHKSAPLRHIQTKSLGNMLLDIQM